MPEPISGDGAEPSMKFLPGTRRHMQRILTLFAQRTAWLNLFRWLRREKANCLFPFLYLTANIFQDDLALTSSGRFLIYTKLI